MTNETNGFKNYGDYLSNPVTKAKMATEQQTKGFENLTGQVNKNEIGR